MKNKGRCMEIMGKKDCLLHSIIVVSGSSHSNTEAASRAKYPFYNSHIIF